MWGKKSRFVDSGLVDWSDEQVRTFLRLKPFSTAPLTRFRYLSFNYPDKEDCLVEKIQGFIVFLLKFEKIFLFFYKNITKLFLDLVFFHSYNHKISLSLKIKTIKRGGLEKSSFKFTKTWWLFWFFWFFDSSQIKAVEFWLR